MVLQTHIFLGSWAGEYLTHVPVPEKQGNAATVSQLVHDVVLEYDSADTLQAVICDNTVLNTGRNGGICILLQQKLGRNVHMLGCMLHFNELPLRGLLFSLDGGAVSGTKLTGPIGKKLTDNSYMSDPVLFTPVETTVTRPAPAVLTDLSDDQLILLEYMLAVSSGSIPDQFVHRKPGPVNLVRWLTIATRILILYTRTVKPTKALQDLVEFVQKVYGPAWFTVKQQQCFVKGPEILFSMIQAKLCTILFSQIFSFKQFAKLTGSYFFFKFNNKNACL